jgi:type I restriction enzyme, S subunit
MTRNAWPLVSLGEIARPVTRPVEVIPGQTYRTIGVKWWGQGAYERETIDGSQTAAKTLSIVRQNDLIINKIWVRHGSTAIASAEVEGCAGSGEFPTFELDQALIFPRWMHWLTKTRAFWSKCDRLSQGTSGKNRIKPELFLTITIPLPSLDDQKRILVRIEELAAKIEEARGLRRETTETLDKLERAALSLSLGKPTPMNQLVELRTPDVEVLGQEIYHFAGVYCFGRGVFRGPQRLGTETAYARLTRLRAGDFIYPKLMAWEGALGTVPNECDGLVVSPEFPVFSVNRERILPEVLDVYFRSPSVWPSLMAASTGTNVRRRRLHPERFLALDIPLPPMENQLRFLEVKTKVDVLRRLQAETANELDALLPSILDKAFKSELV